MKKNIPNILTLLNLFSGCIAMVIAFEGELYIASWLVGLAALFDFGDGFAARLLKVKSKIGKELDSLADVVSFGLVPGTILYILMADNMANIFTNEFWITVLPFSGFLVTLFSALRLAKFNIDERQTAVFFGLPTPANALLLVSFPLILTQESSVFPALTEFMKRFILNPLFLLALTLVLSWLLISEVKLFSLKFHNYSWKNNRARFLLLFISAILLVFLSYTAIPFIIILYIILSLVLEA